MGDLSLTKIVTPSPWPPISVRSHCQFSHWLLYLDCHIFQKAGADDLMEFGDYVELDEVRDAQPSDFLKYPCHIPPYGGMSKYCLSACRGGQCLWPPWSCGGSIRGGCCQCTHPPCPWSLCKCQLVILLISLAHQCNCHWCMSHIIPSYAVLYLSLNEILSECS